MWVEDEGSGEGDEEDEPEGSRGEVSVERPFPLSLVRERVNILEREREGGEGWETGRRERSSDRAHVLLQRSTVASSVAPSENYSRKSRRAEGIVDNKWMEA